jgi:molybdenum cofactor cytidylyltransferase
LINNTAIIILAAGSSSRLGRPKQLLNYHGQSLISNIVDAASKTNFRPVIVVVGCYAKEVSHNLKGKDVTLVLNENWAQGLGSGIAVGIANLIKLKPETNDVILAVCDQPFVTSEFLSKLLSIKNKSQKTIVSSAYAGTYGTPVLFDKKHFDALLKLEGNEGAKKIIEQQKDEMLSVPFLQGSFDIDTEADYIKLIDD